MFRTQVLIEYNVATMDTLPDGLTTKLIMCLMTMIRKVWRIVQAREIFESYRVSPAVQTFVTVFLGVPQPL